jgi:two-component system, NtrC family, sensor histidine kinase PilS
MSAPEPSGDAGRRLTQPPRHEVPAAGGVCAPPLSEDLLPLMADDRRRSSVRLQLFMGTRLGVATLLLGGTLLIAMEDRRGFASFTPRFLVTLIATIYCASLIFAIWLPRSSNRDRVALSQVCTDLVVTTGLVYVTGGPSSGFTFLYGVAVLMAAMVVGPVSARLTGGTAIALYIALAVSLAQGFLPPPSDQRPDAYLPSLNELVYVGLLNVFGLMLVTLLAGNLSARLLSAGGQLRLATASAARLARLNDDIVRSLSSGLLTTELDGRIRSVNPTGLDMLKTDASRLLGRSASSVLQIDFELLMGRLAGQGAGVTRAEANAYRGDGSRFPVGYSISRLLSIDGTSLGALVLFQDLSEITRLREIAARDERLAVLGRLSAGLAHEIRNPLGSISGAVQLVRESPQLNDEESRLLGIVLEEVERLDDLVATMLQVGRPREPHCARHDLRPLLQAIAEMARRGPAVPKRVTIEVDLPSQPIIAWVDRDQVRQVLWNLIKNALQASPQDGAVRVSVAERGGRAVLEVSDEGEGISPSQRDKIYNMFYSERTHGAGIGLALVRQIVDAHAGTIEIRSEERQGATFIVTFPQPATDGRGAATDLSCDSGRQVEELASEV